MVSSEHCSLLTGKHPFWGLGPARRPAGVVLIDDGGWRSIRPLSLDFIIAQDGSFVDED
jgi:hypothetical protein